MLAILGGVFILGIALGVTFSSTTNSTPQNVASVQFIDQSVPDAEVCQAYGASATVMDTRTFVTFKPFSVFISQPIMQPGCVIRLNNIGILQQRKLVSSEQVRECRQRLNTFGFTGKLNDQPSINCLYQSDSDKNRFLDQSGSGTLPREADNF
jgi:hypothetical protein